MSGRVPQSELDDFAVAVGTVEDAVTGNVGKRCR